jgi:hypothetical protein
LELLRPSGKDARLLCLLHALNGGRDKLVQAQQQALMQLLQEDLHLRGPVTIRGRRFKQRTRLWFRGPLTPGEQQRIRNFLALNPRNSISRALLSPGPRLFL